MSPALSAPLLTCLSPWGMFFLLQKTKQDARRASDPKPRQKRRVTGRMSIAKFSARFQRRKFKCIIEENLVFSLQNLKNCGSYWNNLKNWLLLKNLPFMSAKSSKLCRVILHTLSYALNLPDEIEKLPRWGWAAFPDGGGGLAPAPIWHHTCFASFPNTVSCPVLVLVMETVLRSPRQKYAWL